MRMNTRRKKEKKKERTDELGIYKRGDQLYEIKIWRVKQAGRRKRIAGHLKVLEW